MARVWTRDSGRTEMLLDRRRDFFSPTPYSSPAETLLDRYDRDFVCITADQPELLQRALETRYQVYCVENHFEDAEQHRNGIETDEYDSCSQHSVLVWRPTGDTIGTVRLILPLSGHPPSFSMASIIARSGGAAPTPRASTAEVSRFSISKHFRPGPGQPAPAQAALARQAEPLLSLGLIQGLVRMSRMNAITHWCAVMEPKMLRMLSAMGIHFTPTGPLIEYHGLRQLCHCELATVLKTVLRERPAFWDVITDGGRLA